MPLSERFTLSTSSAWRSMDILRWMMPMPPFCASAIARCDSVTVSMAELTTGMFKPILRVSQVRVSVWFGSTSLRAGSNKISSNVRPSGIVSGIMRVNFDHTLPDRLTGSNRSIRRWSSLGALDHKDFHLRFAALQLEPESILQESLPQRKALNARFQLQIHLDVVSPFKAGLVQNGHQRPPSDAWFLWI